MSPERLCQNNAVKIGTIERQGKITIHQLTWSTAMVNMPAGQSYLSPAKVEIAYASHHHLYNIWFSTPPEQFAANKGIFNAIFQSFQEKQ
ncbi:hypothetical protein [Ktedonospora formicarum]|uniref:Uncharacterized protein n=1 Tax=Ktedonospora formicarum TaxID=2778364 RepID=A0A8J3I6J6_9CHLR|nr:hypothetical protein [Ktedonospora formicarum]GHO51272.1 hypothetical protein KSX_94350 [Ktedonospora formicarum]